MTGATATGATAESTKISDSNRLMGMSILEHSTPQMELTSIDKIGDLIQGLVTSKAGTEFETSIQLTSTTIKRESPCLLNQLMECGAPLVLTRCLARAIAVEERRVEIDSICEILLILFGSSAYFAARALQKVVGELYPLLLGSLLLGHVHSNVIQLTKRLSKLPVRMEEVEEKEHLFSVFKEAIHMADNQKTDAKAVVGIIQLLTGLVTDFESRRLFFADTSLFEVLIRNHSRLQKAPYQLAAFALVAARDLNSRMKTLDISGFVPLLTLLLRDGGLETKKIAVALTRILASERALRSQLIKLGGPELLESLFECTRDANANELVRCLISTETATLFHEDEGLIKALTRDDGLKYESEVFAKAMYRLASTIRLKGKGLNLIFDAILRLSSSNDKQIKIWGARSLYKQSLVEACSFFFTRTPPAIKRITMLANDHCPEIQYIGVKTIGNLASHPLNQRALTKNAAILLSLTKAVTEQTSKEAVEALLKLAETSKHAKTLAKQHNVVASLSRYGLLPCAGNENKQLRKQALACVVRLVPLM